MEGGSREGGSPVNRAAGEGCQRRAWAPVQGQGRGRGRGRNIRPCGPPWPARSSLINQSACGWQWKWRRACRWVRASLASVSGYSFVLFRDHGGGRGDLSDQSGGREQALCCERQFFHTGFVQGYIPSLPRLYPNFGPAMTYCQATDNAISCAHAGHACVTSVPGASRRQAHSESCGTYIKQAWVERVAKGGKHRIYG